MMVKIFTLVLALTGLSAVAQNNEYHSFANVPNVANSTGFSGTGANIDVKYHKLSWRINPDSSVKYIKGYVQTNFLTTQSNVSAITFDLNAVLTVDSVRFRNNRLPAGNINHSGNILSVSLGTVLPLNTLDSLWIYYQGTPPSPSGSSTGFVRTSSATAGNYITTLSESYEDRDWWPCKADMQDKIDSLDMIVNVPWASPTSADTFWVAGNGVLIDSAINGPSRTFSYKTRYPIASYLVFVSVARFNRYYRGNVPINGGSVPAVYYILAGKTPTDYSNTLAAMDHINLVMQAFSDRFGPYPFRLEKHGFYDGLVGAGGMEHQTFSGINQFALQNRRTLSHELMHQWFGDNVTFATWNDLWLAEGFARYSECLAAELVPVLGLSAFNIRNNFKISALSLSTTSLWIPDASIVTSNSIWSSGYGQAVYERGSMIVSMLRAICGDNKFFQALTNYQSGQALSSASGDILKSYFNTVAGQDLTPFFNDYVGGSGNGTTPVGGIGNPNYVINWSNPLPNKLNVSVGSQSQSSGSNVSYFRSPVVLHVTGVNSSQDTTITFFDWGGGNLSYAGDGLSTPIPGNSLSYTLSFNPVSVAFDDSSRTLSTGSTVKLSVVGVQLRNFEGVVNGNANKISLSVESSELPSRVEIYKSNDGSNFTLAGEMEFVGGSQTYQYNFNDVHPYAITFYKARIIFPNQTEVTDIVQVYRNENIALTLQPNPASENVSIRFSNASAKKYTVRFIDSEGRKVKEASTLSGNLNINVHDLPAGIYNVQLIDGRKILEVQRLLVNRY